jgi:site-specific DNA-methyltransferase (adenine-specific)
MGRCSFAAAFTACQGEQNCLVATVGVVVEDRRLEQIGGDFYETPPEIFLPLKDEFGFTVDVCATKWTAKCPRFYTPKEDGLSVSWAGDIVWCNPPYSNVTKWVRKAWQESQNPGTVVVMLLWARLDSSWCEAYVLPDLDGASERRVHNAAELRFPRGRVTYLLRGERQGSPMLPAMVVVFRYGHIGSPVVSSIRKARSFVPLAKRKKLPVARILL